MLEDYRIKGTLIDDGHIYRQKVESMDSSRSIVYNSLIMANKYA